MNNERKNHSFPTAPKFPTLEQLENSMDSLGAYDSQRSDRYHAMKREARKREIEQLESDQRLGAITKRGRRTLNKLNMLKQEEEKIVR